MTKLIAGLMAAGSLLLLTGCSETVHDRGALEGDFGSDGYIKARDGREVYCVFYDKGLDCDWANAKKP
ncbi:hypothetical protein SEA_NANOSMITE_5 [Mycobacterium phage Nanosmite]|nr:hypothetical protein SEA_NANOSMITE_5 [Mycobacterium phage Nanosmite]